MLQCQGNIKTIRTSFSHANSRHVCYYTPLWSSREKTVDCFNKSSIVWMPRPHSRHHYHNHAHGKRLNYIITPFASPYLSEFRRTLVVLGAVKEVVGVLETTCEGKVSLLALISIMTHFFFVERQHF